MLNQSYLTHKVLRLLRGHKAISAVCDKKWELFPSHMTQSPPAIFLDGMLDRVTGVAFGTTYEFEMLRVQGGDREHFPTKVYSLRHATIVDGHIYKAGLKYPIVDKREPLWMQGSFETWSEVALSCTWCGNRFFGNWMRDDLPLGFITKELAEPITVKRNLFPHEAGYREMFNICAQPVRNAKCENLLVVDDIGQNNFRRHRYETMRSHVKALYSKAAQRNPGVMIRRGHFGSQRNLENQTEVEQFFQQLGFAIVDQELSSAHDLAQQVQDAEVVVGVEGSHLAHGLYGIAEGGTFLVLQHPNRFGNVYKDYADCLGLHYAFVIGTPQGDGFHIDLGELEQTIDLLNARIGSA